MRGYYTSEGSIRVVRLGSGQRRNHHLYRILNGVAAMLRAARFGGPGLHTVGRPELDPARALREAI
jgi:hypothetical protein